MVEIARFVRTVVAHLKGVGARYYQETGNLYRTILYLVRHALWARRYVVKRRIAMKTIPSSSDSVAQGALHARRHNLPFLAIRVSGGVGDYVIIARFLRDLAASVEPFQFDVYCGSFEHGRWAFSGVPGYRETYSDFLFDHFKDEYSLALRISQFVVVHGENAHWESLRAFHRLMQAINQIIRFRSKIEIMIERHPFMDGFLAQKAVYMNLSRANFLHGMASIAYGGPALALETDASFLTQLHLRDRPFITISNGFDAEFPLSRRQATKCYPHSAKLVRLIKEKFPDVAVVQVGTTTSIPIPYADINLLGKTNLKQVAAIIGQAQLHIDNEGGLVHIASCLGTRSCVIFGPTSADYFAYEDNINIRPTFCGGCWWINETWMDSCPRRFETARCMSEMPPEYILAKIAAEWGPAYASSQAKANGDAGQPAPPSSHAQRAARC